MECSRRRVYVLCKVVVRFVIWERVREMEVDWLGMESCSSVARDTSLEMSVSEPLDRRVVMRWPVETRWEEIA